MKSALSWKIGTELINMENKIWNAECRLAPKRPHLSPAGVFYSSEYCVVELGEQATEKREVTSVARQWRYTEGGGFCESLCRTQGYR